ncbi:hypothetical protein ABLN97_01035 [Mycobacterium tuberculosis]
MHPKTGCVQVPVVEPGSGWPGDPATPQTPVYCRCRRGRSALAGGAGSTCELNAGSACRACPRLVSWREEVAVVKRRAFADQPYWGARCRGAEAPRLLTPAGACRASGANRTGRMFTAIGREISRRSTCIGLAW